MVYQISLTRLKGIGPVQARILLEHFGSATAIFSSRLSQLEKIEGIGSYRAASISAFCDFEAVAEEVLFLEKFGIRALFLTDPDYPRRLLNCTDPPTLLYYRGSADLNPSRVLAVVGTRNNSPYGKQVTEALIEGLSASGVLVMSGLAFGIDALAHRKALQVGLPTVGVLGHGLDQVYPLKHQGLARDMLESGGGLLTEFGQGVEPDRHHFPSRNRIVAGMSDAILVVESGLRGGSMVTADLANGYNRDVFAFPGRTSDLRSEGCNYLIKNNKAMLITCADDLLDCMGWKEKSAAPANRQTALLLDLTEEEKKLTDLMQGGEPVHVDQLYFLSGLSGSALAGILLSLELRGLLRSLPGKRYQLNG